MIQSQSSDKLESLRSELTGLVGAVKEALQADVASLFVYDEASQYFHLPVGIGLNDPESFHDPQLRPRVDRGAPKRVLSDSCLIVENLGQDTELNGAFAHRERIQSLAGVTCTFNNQINGVLFVSYRSHHKFQRQETEQLKEFALRGAELIDLSSVLRQLPNVQEPPSSPTDATLQNVVELACSMVKAPVAIWLIDKQENNRLRIHASTGISKHFRDGTSCHLDDHSLISRVFASGRYQAAENLGHDPRFANSNVAETEGWVSAFGYPIVSRGKRVGVLESFTYNPWREDLGLIAIHRHLADLAGIALENARRAEEAERLAELAREMGAAPDLESGLQHIVKAARELSGADSSSIFFYDKKTGRFSTGVRSPLIEVPTELPREDGLTRHIIDTGESVYIPDSDIDNKYKRKENRAKTLIGVRLEIDQEGVGVLYIRGSRTGQFDNLDMNLLTRIAAQASLVLGVRRSLEQSLLKSIGEIEAAATRRFERESILEEIHSEVHKLGFQYSAIQVINLEDRTIETVSTKGAPHDWSGVAKHSLDAEDKVSDIQAEISLAIPPCIKIITGWYKKFDPWIFDEFQHRHYARVWVPIIVMRDKNGAVVEDWYEFWNGPNDPPQEKEIYDENVNRKGYITCIEMHIPNSYLDSDHRLEVIGTIEAGYYDFTKEPVQLRGIISIKQAISLGKLAARMALKLSKTTLTHVLETIADHAKQISRADTSSLHFLYNPERRQFSHNVSIGSYSQRNHDGYYPRPGGLGLTAIKEKKVKFMPDFSLGQDEVVMERNYPDIWKSGIRSFGIFPISIGEYAGVLYAFFTKPHQFTEEEIRWIQVFANLATESIRNSLNYTRSRDNERALAALHTVSQSLTAKPQDEQLLRQLAGQAINVLAADIISIYEYIETEDRFLLPSTRAGRLLDETDVQMKLNPGTGPFLLLQTYRNADPNKNDTNVYYSEDALNDPLMNNPEREHREQNSFVVREKIKASAGIVLRVGKETPKGEPLSEIVGVMFVHYRRPHKFNDREKQIISTLASTAAIAIKNRRLFTTIDDEIREILTSLDKKRLFFLVVQRAVKITNADVGNIRLVEGPVSDDLVAYARFPKDEPIDPYFTTVKIGVGCIGKVAHNKTSKIVYDTGKEPDYLPYFKKIYSALYVPMKSKDDVLFGVLGTGSKKPNKFDDRDRMALEALADQAVIALQNIHKQEQLAASEAMARVGDVTGNLIHRLNNYVGAIREFARMLNYEVEDKNKSTAKDIVKLSEKILADAAKLGVNLPERIEGADIANALKLALNKIQIPKIVIPVLNGLDYPIPLAEGNEAQLQNIFMNLIQNAVEAMPQGGQLEIGAEALKHDNRPWIKVLICDTGCGIPHDLFDKIFERNYSTKGSGLGFGLWWSKNYIERLGGRIEVKSSPGQGTCFTVFVPASKI